MAIRNGEIDKNWLIQRLVDLPNEIAMAEKDMLKLMQDLEKEKERLLDTEMSLIREGKIEGKNESERKANMRVLTTKERERVKDEESNLEAYKIFYHQKLNEFSALKAVARLLAKEVE